MASACRNHAISGSTAGAQAVAQAVVLDASVVQNAARDSTTTCSGVRSRQAVPGSRGNWSKRWRQARICRCPCMRRCLLHTGAAVQAAPMLTGQCRRQDAGD